MKQHILICPDKFKGGLSSPEVASCMARGILQGFPDARLDICPLADGGEGTLDALLEATRGRRIAVRVTGPLKEPVDALFGVLGDERTAVIEMALASGLSLIPPEARDPLLSTTRGTGELIAAALDQGYRSFVIAIGGSGTCDGGVGMAQALGVRFLDSGGRDLSSGGGALADLESIDLDGLDPRVAASSCIVASDVDSPLCGAQGAAAVYAPQKGASPQAVQALERGLCRLAEVVREETGKDLAACPGAGAAGGLGFGLMAWVHAELRPGVEVVMQAAGFSDRLRGCRLALTGEGRLDEQTAHGKTVAGVARAAAAQSVPVVALAGEIAGGLDELHEQGLTAALGILPGPQPLPEAIAHTASHLESTCRELGRLLHLSLPSVNR